MSAKGREAALRRWQDPEYRAYMLELRRSRPVKTEEERKAARRAYYEQHQEQIKARSRAWYAANRERAAANAKARYDREASRERYDRWMSNPENRAKANAKLAEYMREHPELRQKYESMRRARKRGVFVEEVDRNVVLARYSGLCGICGDAVDPERFDVDHIIPLLVGGQHSYANTQPAHPSCNYRKPRRPKEIAA